jgi:diguanylate cyclase (GGDEF)-like protein/PAS domain S-box-containing protein
MRRISASLRIVLGLISLTISALLMAGLLGLIPNVSTAVQKDRSAFCESAAVSFMALAPRMNAEEIVATFDSIRSRNPDVESIAVRTEEEGQLLFKSGPHDSLWETRGATPATSREFIVPISANGGQWGQLEVRFQKIPAGLFGSVMRPEFSLAIVLGCGLFVTFWIYLRRVLSHLNPNRVIPPRVREALDALAEGLLVMDTDCRIVLANSAFSQHVGRNAEELFGKNACGIGFRSLDDSRESESSWVITARSARTLRGVLMKIGSGPDERTFSVSTVPIHDEKQRCRGVVASFEDVTELDRKQKELRDALISLRASSEEIQQQNRELEWLATRDVLTGCVNRRSFFKGFETVWNQTVESGGQLSAVMVDIDHFKAINDNHGHATGDDVLRRVAAVVMKTAGGCDVVCRYGGEEFSMLMPDTSLDEAELRAERIRLAIKALRIGELRVTASLGVSSLSQQASSPQELLDQADKCLYVAKRNGRNQVVRFDRAQRQIAQISETVVPIRKESRKSENVTIPFQAVSALVSAMSFRDLPTAAHSRRVADLCVATAEGLLSMRECYTLEIAALMHDIGKIGVPDAILQKSGSLTDEEWSIMRRHRTVSVQLVKASFGSEMLTEIVGQFSLWFDLSNLPPGSHSRAQPCVAARVLAIADAYDSMTSSATYRKRKSRTEAFEELRRCAGTQFDPELVERFISAVRLRSGERTEMPGVSTDIALDIGVQIERLVAALDDQDLDELRDLTKKLHQTVDQAGIENMADVADQLIEALDHDKDMIGIMQAANELLDLCRLTQVSLIQGDTHRLVTV